MSYSKANIEYAGSVSGDVTTVGTDEVITMQNGAAEDVTVGALAIECVTALELKINGEANYHAFAAGEKFNYENISITQIVIKTAASQIKYKGLHV